MTETTDQRQNNSDITDYVKDPRDNKPTNQPTNQPTKRQDDENIRVQRKDDDP